MSDFSDVLVIVVYCLCLSYCPTTNSTISCLKCSKGIDFEINVDCNLTTKNDSEILSCLHLDDGSCTTENATTCYLNIKYKKITDAWTASIHNGDNRKDPSTLPRSTCSEFLLANPMNIERSSLGLAITCYCNTTNCNTLGNYSLPRSPPTTAITTSTYSISYQHTTSTATTLSQASTSRLLLSTSTTIVSTTHTTTTITSHTTPDSVIISRTYSSSIIINTTTSSIQSTGITSTINDDKGTP